MVWNAGRHPRLCGEIEPMDADPATRWHAERYSDGDRGGVLRQRRQHHRHAAHSDADRPRTCWGVGLMIGGCPVRRPWSKRRRQAHVAQQRQTFPCGAWHRAPDDCRSPHYFQAIGSRPVRSSPASAPVGRATMRPQRVRKSFLRQLLAANSANALTRRFLAQPTQLESANAQHGVRNRRQAQAG